jgi:hypothetical protein
MKQFIGFFLLVLLFSGLTSCSHNSIEKPDNLISKSTFTKMMVDMYLIQAMIIDTANQPKLKKVTQTDLYFSVLKKYSIPDTVFIRSLMYYSSFPKDFEKMHVEIMNILNEKEEKFRPANALRTKEE